MPDPTSVVIAMTYSRFVDWCRAHKLNPRSSALLYVDPDYMSLRGRVLRRGIDQVIDLGGCPEALAYAETRFRA